MMKLLIDTARDSALLDPNDPDTQAWHDPDGRVCAYVQTRENQHRIDVLGVASFGFSSDNGSDTVRAAPSSPARLELVREAFHRLVLPMALQARGVEILHASAVQVGEAVVALCGHSGAGKSTTAAALSRRGYAAWADDAVVFETTPSSVMAIPLPFVFRLLPDTASFFRKEPYPASAAGQRKEAKQLPLGALFLLKRAAGRAPDIQSVRLSQPDALMAALSHAWCFTLQDQERKKRMIRQYLELSANVPVYQLEYPAGLERLQALVDSILQTVARV